MSPIEILKPSLEHLAKLPDIEKRAASIFSDDDVPPNIRDSAISPAELRAGYDAQLLWIAAAKRSPVGFILLNQRDDSLHIREINVLPEFAQRGIGRRLINKSFAIARQRNISTVTLTTFHHLPWNAPFYTKCGFLIVPDDKLTTSLKRNLATEISAGLSNRVAMAAQIE